MHVHNWWKKIKNSQQIKGKNSQKIRGPCFLPQTQKHLHSIRKKNQLTNKKQGMRQTMPHVYKMSKHPKDKGYKKEYKTAKKKG
jgi:hypothetical protein